MSDHADSTLYRAVLEAALAKFPQVDSQQFQQATPGQGFEGQAFSIVVTVDAARQPKPVQTGGDRAARRTRYSVWSNWRSHVRRPVGASVRSAAAT